MLHNFVIVISCTNLESRKNQAGHPGLKSWKEYFPLQSCPYLFWHPVNPLFNGYQRLFFRGGLDHEDDCARP